MDAGGIVVGWLLKISVVLFIIGICGFDGIAVGSARLNAVDDANSAASAAATDYQATHNVTSALAAAVHSISTPNEQILGNSLTIGADGSATVSLERKVTTLVMYRIGPLRKYTVIRVKGEAAAPTS
jgi:hypothetical protein